MGVDDDADCVEHVFDLQGVHLSIERGAEREVTCARCGAVGYVTDETRKSRPKLRPA